ncbi:MerR family transcriptional regulator [Frigidibacter oleivorans]|uniref:MerR family transcriptional regulator n=1 Tax=Frigidibacter oleivorans TaxID=2487129 RepID=UPI001F27FFE1|nr:MerR family transcriptional regulator [Frigidibacter oleivorans]
MPPDSDTRPAPTAAPDIQQGPAPDDAMPGGAEAGAAAAGAAAGTAAEGKSSDAFRTISEVSVLLATPAHVLRFWESRFSQIRPVKRAGGRRYYRPNDVALLAGIRKLLHDDGMTIRGVQKLLREQGTRAVAAGQGLRIAPVTEPAAEKPADGPPPDTAAPRGRRTRRREAAGTATAPAKAETKGAAEKVVEDRAPDLLSLMAGDAPAPPATATPPAAGTEATPADTGTGEHVPDDRPTAAARLRHLTRAEAARLAPALARLEPRLAQLSARLNGPPRRPL